MASMVAPGSSDGGVQGLTCCMNRDSDAYRVPTPARLVWSSRAAPMVTPPLRFAAARAGFQSGPSTSGPRWPTSVRSSAVGTTSSMPRRWPRAVHRAVLNHALVPPLSLHAQVRVDGETVVEAVQQMLTATDHLECGAAAEVECGQFGPTQLAAGQWLTGQRLMQALRGAPDGVAFRHAGPGSSPQPEALRGEPETGFAEGAGQRVVGA